MLDQEIEEIIALLLGRTIGAREHQTLQDVLDADIPAGVKTFLAADILQHLRGELDPSPHFARVVSSSPETVQQRESFLRRSALQYRFPREDFLVALDNAVHFLVNYLCRPRWTLQEFLLDGSETVSKEKLLSKLSFLNDYEYYRVLVRKILDAKGWQEISRERLHSMLSSIDEGYLRGMNGKDIASLTSPMFSFFSLRNVSSPGRIPYKALFVFLIDKNMPSTSDYLEKMCRVRNANEISMQEFADILQDMPAGYEAASTETSSVPSPIEEKKIEPVEENPTNVNEATEQHSPEPVVPAPAKRNIALSLTFAGLTEKPPVATRVSVNSLISPELRSLFVKEVFSNDPTYYSAIVATLDATSDWKAAESYMTRFCEINELDPQGHEVGQFMEIIRQRFLTESGNA